MRTSTANCRTWRFISLDGARNNGTRIKTLFRDRRIDAPLEVKLAGWALLPDVQAKREAHARELAAREESARQQREVGRQTDALRHANTLQRHQQDVARFNSLADALLNPEEPTEW